MANEDKNISYLNKDFGSFKTELQQYAKTYFLMLVMLCHFT